MEIKVLEHDKSTLKIEVIGEDHTICNALSKELWKDKSVKVSGYRMEQEIVSNPVMVVQSNDPKKSLLDAIGRLKGTCKELKGLFSGIK